MRITLTFLAVFCLLLPLKSQEWDNVKNEVKEELKGAISETIPENIKEFIPNDLSRSSISSVWEAILKEANLQNKIGTLPIGLARKVNEHTLVIALDAFKTDPTNGPSFDAFTAIEFPWYQQRIDFVAKNVLVGPGGLRASAEKTKLCLASRHKIPLLGNKVEMILEPGCENFVSWDCNGFKGIQFSGILEFNEDFIVTADSDLSENQDGTVKKGKRLQTKFSFYIEDLSDIMVTVSLPKFKSVAQPDIEIEARNITLDLSDVLNPLNLKFPEMYDSGYDPEDINLWRGFYAEALSVKFLKGLGSKGNCEGIEMSANNLIIDNMGITIEASASNLQSCFNVGTWPFTVSSANLGIVKNRLYKGGLSGDAHIPLLNDEPMPFIGEVSQTKNGLDYMFGIKFMKDKEYPIPAFSGSVVLKQGSQLKVAKDNGKFKGMAILHGDLNIKNEILKARDITFENLTLVTESPFITDGIFSVSSNKDENKVGGFPISFDSLRLNINKGNPILFAGIQVNFMDKNSFTGKADVTLYSKQNGGEKLSWSVHKVEVGEVSINANIGSVKVNGKASFFNDDATYGNGFHGKVKLGVGGFLSDMDAQMYFGCKDFRYWQASLRVPVEIPLPPVPLLYLTSIRGGVAYQMSRPNGYVTSLMERDNTDRNETYIPDNSRGLSLLAGVGLEMKKGSMVGKADLELSFTKSFGLAEVKFDGDAAFFASKDKFLTSQSSDYPIYASLSMQYLTEYKTFDARLTTKIDIAKIIKGGGEAAIHISPKSWHVYIGRPSSSWGLSVLNFVKVESYFMTGTQLEPLPTIPDKMKKEIPRDRGNLLANLDVPGAGMAFGARFNTKFGIDAFVYAYVEVGAGADIMLRRYPETAVCTNTGDLGINNWYASGQAYAYLEGALGVKFRKKKFDIMRLNIAALLKAEMPNPYWFNAKLSARYRLLGGLIRGSVRLSMDLGTKCQLDLGGDELGVKMISDIIPQANEKDVSIFTSPQIAFNASIDKSFQMENLLNKVETYRVKLDKLDLVGPKGKMTIAEQVWNSDRTSVALTPQDVLEPMSDIKVDVSIHVEKRVGTEAWKPFVDETGEGITEDKNVTFKTGTAPDYITEDNIKYTYPIETQYNFYPKEYNKGYVQLKQNIAYLFEKENKEGSWDFVARYTDAKNKIHETPLTYNPSGAVVDFGVPADLSLANVYKMDIVRILKSGPVNMDDNMKKDSITLASSGSMEETVVTDNTLEGNKVIAGEKTLYTINFRTSKYPSFSEKLKRITNEQSVFNTNSNKIFYIIKAFYTDEAFDEFEKHGKSGSFNPLTSAEAIPEGKWYKTFLKPVMYDVYKNGDANITINNRNIDVLGLIPTKAVSVINATQLQYPKLTNVQIMSKNAVSFNERVFIKYDVSDYTYRDYFELKNKVGSSKNLNAPNVRALMENRGYVDYWSGNYPLYLQYKLPGINKVTTSKKYTITF